MQSFREVLDIPDIVTGLFRMKGRGGGAGYELDERFSLQISRGIPPRMWEAAPRNGCFRCMAMFNDFGVVSRYCFDCYKVVISPRSVVELFKLLLAYEKMVLPHDNTRKCMIESRDYCSGNYKGYIYNRGKDEGKEVLKIVRDVIDESISPDVPVTFKRGCSEYAQVYPEYAQIDADTDPMEYRKDWKFYEDFVDENYVFRDTVDAVGDGKADYPSRELFAMQYWLRYAATIGDMSYLVLTEGKTLAPLPQP